MAGERPASVNYTPYPTVQPEETTGAGPMGVRASPEDFGSQVGGAVEKAGDKGFDVAQQLQGAVNETAQNTAEVGFLKDSGELKNKYMQLEGLAAEAARPQYEAQLAALHSQYRQGLPPGVQRGFDSTTLRQMAYQTNSYSEYAAQQIKSDHIKSTDAIADQSIAAAGDLGNVTDPKQFAWHRDSIIAAGNATADIHGDSQLATGHTARGDLSYPDTPDGQAAQSRHLQYTDTKLAQYYLTSAKTVADNQGATASANWVQAHWNEMPDKAKVEVNQFLAPKMVNEDIDGAVATANSNMAAKTQQQTLSNVPSSPTAPLSVRNNNPGNLRDQTTGAFRTFNTPEEGASAMQADLTAKVNGNSPAMEKNFGKGYSPTLSNVITTYAPASDNNNTKAYIDTVSKETGFSPNQVLTAADVPKLQAAMTKVEAGGSGSNPPQKQYSNDYERLTDQRQSFIDSAVNAITEKRGSDLGLIATTTKRAEANIDAQIRVAKGALDSDQKNVQDAIDGNRTKGQVPMTLEQLRAVPSMADLVDKVQREQPEFYGSILTRIAKAQHADATQNSPNAYDAIQATLDTSKPYSRQEQIEYLSKGLGSDNPGYSISQKDYNDAKPAIDLTTDGKSTLSEGMKNIANANGNIDGKGQERAVQWYNQVMAARKAEQAKGDKGMPDSDFFDSTKNPSLPAPIMPSRQQQINNVAREAQAAGKILMMNPDGKPGYVPAAQVDEATKLGYKKAQ